MKIELSEIGDPEKAQFFVRGKVFNIEHKSGLIYPQANPALVTFFDSAVPIYGYYLAVFNDKTGSIERKAQEDFHEKKIMLPEILFKGPIKDNELLNNINKQCFKDDAGFVIANQTIIDRLMGKLRVVDIMGDKYFLDIRFEELRSVKDFTRKLSFKEFVQDEGKVTGWYDKSQKQMADIDSDYITRTPKNVYLVELPTWFRLDPVSYARIDQPIVRSHTEGDTAYLNDVMMETQAIAKATHISNTYMAKHILKNRQRLKLPPEKMRVVSPQKPKGRKL